MKRTSPATIIASIALFFSLSGAGMAASHYLITSASQIKPSVRTELRGQAGPQGQTGPQGAQGPQGAPGSNGQQTRFVVGLTGSARPIAAGATDSADVACPGTMIDIAGGFKSTGGTVVMTQSAESNNITFGWNVQVTNIGSTSGSWAPTVTCATP